MWKPNWAAKQPNNYRLAGMIVWLVVLVAAACSAGETVSPVPTLTLFPATLTFTPSPVPPTATQAALPGPADIATSTPEASLPSDAASELDPVAAELVRLAQRRLGDDQDLPTQAMRVVDVMPVRWPDSSLGCPLPGQTYTPVQIDGYRIVLAAGDREYIFHSDFDRVLPCDASSEQLPDAE